MKKIKNEPNDLAVDTFTYVWDSIDTNFSLRNTEFNNENSANLTTKFIGEYYMFVDGEPVYGFCAFGVFIIFVKEYNAYYMADFSRLYSEMDDILYDGDSRAHEDKLEFTLIPKGTYGVPTNTAKKSLTNQLGGSYDKLKGLTLVK